MDQRAIIEEERLNGLIFSLLNFLASTMVGKNIHDKWERIRKSSQE